MTWWRDRSSHRSGRDAVIGQRWGVTDEEVRRSYPCDELAGRGLAAAPGLALWRGVTVDAPPERVWPWLRQLQLAPYSYDLVDNLGRRSPRELREVPEPQVGARFFRCGGVLGVGRVLTVVGGQHVTGRVWGAGMSYVLVPQDGRTRLLLKVVLPSRSWLAALLAVGDWPMARRQLLNLKRLAESSSGESDLHVRHIPEGGPG